MNRDNGRSRALALFLLAPLATACAHDVVRHNRAGDHAQAVAAAQGRKRDVRGPAARAYAGSLAALGELDQARAVLQRDRRRGGSTRSLEALIDLELEHGLLGAAAANATRWLRLDPGGAARAQTRLCPLFVARADALQASGQALAAYVDRVRADALCESDEPGASTRRATERRLRERLRATARAQVEAERRRELRSLGAVLRDEALESAIAAALAEGPRALLELAASHEVSLVGHEVITVLRADLEGRLDIGLLDDVTIRGLVGTLRPEAMGPDDVLAFRSLLSALDSVDDPLIARALRVRIATAFAGPRAPPQIRPQPDRPTSPQPRSPEGGGPAASGRSVSTAGGTTRGAPPAGEERGAATEPADADAATLWGLGEGASDPDAGTPDLATALVEGSLDDARMRVLLDLAVRAQADPADLSNALTLVRTLVALGDLGGAELVARSSLAQQDAARRDAASSTAAQSGDARRPTGRTRPADPPTAATRGVQGPAAPDITRSSDRELAWVEGATDLEALALSLLLARIHDHRDRAAVSSALELAALTRAGALDPARMQAWREAAIARELWLGRHDRAAALVMLPGPWSARGMQLQRVVEAAASMAARLEAPRATSGDAHLSGAGDASARPVHRANTPREAASAVPSSARNAAAIALIEEGTAREASASSSVIMSRGDTRGGPGAVVSPTLASPGSDASDVASEFAHGTTWSVISADSGMRTRPPAWPALTPAASALSTDLDRRAPSADTDVRGIADGRLETFFVPGLGTAAPVSSRTGVARGSAAQAGDMPPAGSFDQGGCGDPAVWAVVDPRAHGDVDPASRARQSPNAAATDGVARLRAAVEGPHAPDVARALVTAFELAPALACTRGQLGDVLLRGRHKPLALSLSSRYGALVEVDWPEANEDLAAIALAADRPDLARRFLDVATAKGDDPRAIWLRASLNAVSAGAHDLTIAWLLEAVAGTADDGSDRGLRRALVIVDALRLVTAHPNVGRVERIEALEAFAAGLDEHLRRVGPRARAGERARLRAAWWGVARPPQPSAADADVIARVDALLAGDSEDPDLLDARGGGRDESVRPGAPRRVDVRLLHPASLGDVRLREAIVRRQGETALVGRALLGRQADRAEAIAQMPAFVREGLRARDLAAAVALPAGAAALQPILADAVAANRLVIGSELWLWIAADAPPLAPHGPDAQAQGARAPVGSR